MTKARSLLNNVALRITEVGRGLIAAPQESSLTELCEKLLSGRGEATGLATACAVFGRYAHLTDDKKAGFFQTLNDQFGGDNLRFAQALKQ